ncbi:CDP-glycerol glycerophosphotransferase family protein [Limosilactobacillus pontis]|uniref:CDP-glycerol glycerophosphotransferase family protein n=1 Tax=Limosilactobacillus pontis TaxID=35787 RepID=UPI0024202EFE|nr:CDP-glycerol glycerophosphotransferase family protein [Limosilactobacillus pontis]
MNHNTNKVSILKKTVKSFLIKSIRLFSYFCVIQNNKIVVDNFFGKGYGDNPKYIVSYLLKNYPNIDVVWLINGKANRDDFPQEVRLIKFGSLRSIYELSTAHIWIDNIKNNYKGEKRKGQFYLQTWHGGIGFKKVEKAAIDHLSADYIAASRHDSEITDLMISDSDWVTNNYRKNFWYNGKILKSGFPRDDIFFSNVKSIKDKVKRFYSISPDTEIILYAPTFRSYINIEEQTKVCSFNAKDIVRSFENKFGKKFVLIKRMHPNVASRITIKDSKFEKNGSIYPDMQELLVSSFALITDFSSCAFDFMLTSNKIFLFAKDYDDYISHEREMEFSVKKDLPFSFANNEKELRTNISSFDNTKAQEKINEFKDKVKLVDDGKASERVSNALIEEINRNKNE